MNHDKLKQLIETADPQDKIKLTVLSNAVVKGIKEYRDSPTAAKLKDWKAAEAALDEYARSVAPEPDADGRSLPNALAVVDYLSKNGWKIKKSAAYKHIQEKKLRPNRDGRYTVVEIERYAAAYLKRKDGIEQDVTPIDTIQQEKLRAETDKMKAQAEHWQIRAKAASGQYVDKGYFDQELARRAAIFRADLEGFVRSKASDITALVQGDALLIPHLIDYMQSEVETVLARYSEERPIEVPAPSLPDVDGETDGDMGMEEDGDDE